MSTDRQNRQWPVVPIAGPLALFTLMTMLSSTTAAEGGSASVHITDHKDFCVFGPAELGESLAGSEGKLVSWCTKPQNGERQIPEGALTGVTVVKTDQWVQVSGVSIGLPLAKCLAEVTKLIDSGDLTKLNIASHDPGAQLDSAGHKPEGAVVQAGGKTAENWVSMMSSDTFCLRACLGDAKFCPTDLADKGCYVLLNEAVGMAGSFRTCTSDAGKPPMEQGNPAPEWRDCQEESGGAEHENGAKQGDAGGGNGSGQDGKDPKGEGEPDQDGKPGDKDKSEGEGQGATPTSEAEWVPVETCVPCDGPAGEGDRDAEEEGETATTTSSSSASSTGSSSSSALGSESGPGTSQQGISPVETGKSNNGAGAKGRDDGAASPKITDARLDDMMERRHIKRQDPPVTFTKNGQCCHTTWTQATATPTSSGAPTGAAAAGAAGASTGGASGTAHPSGARAVNASGLITAGSTGAAAVSGAHNATSGKAAGATAAGTRNVTVDPLADGAKNGSMAGNRTTGNETSWASRGAIVPLTVGLDLYSQAALLIPLLLTGIYTLL